MISPDRSLVRSADREAWLAARRGDTTQEIPQRFPPPLGRVKTVNGVTYPVTEDRVFIPECGQLARLQGVGLVVCVRRRGHPVAINYGHTNGYVEWCFDEEEA